MDVIESENVSGVSDLVTSRGQIKEGGGLCTWWSMVDVDER